MHHARASKPNGQHPSEELVEARAAIRFLHFKTRMSKKSRAELLAMFGPFTLLAANDWRQCVSKGI